MGHLGPHDKVVEVYEQRIVLNRIIAAVDETGMLTAADFKESIARAREEAVAVGTDYHH